MSAIYGWMDRLTDGPDGRTDGQMDGGYKFVLKLTEICTAKSMYKDSTLYKCKNEQSGTKNRKLFLSLRCFSLHSLHEGLTKEWIDKALHA